MSSIPDVEIGTPYVVMSVDALLQQKLQKAIDGLNSFNLRCQMFISVIFGIVQIIFGAMFHDNKHSFMTFSTWLLVNGSFTVMLMIWFVKEIRDMTTAFKQPTPDLNNILQISISFGARAFVCSLFWYAWFVCGIVLLAQCYNNKPIELRNMMLATIIIQSCASVLQWMFGSKE